jgi:TrmH family RNA methyltransferase
LGCQPLYESGLNKSPGEAVRFPLAVSRKLGSVIITSRQHPLIKLARSLHSGKGRREHGLFLIEGRNAVAAALSVEFPIREVLAAPDETELSGRAEDLGLNVHRVESEVLASAGEAQTALPIMAFGEMPISSDKALPPSLLVLDGIADPGNVGTLWRAADAAGIRGVLNAPGGADPFSPKVVRSAAGSLFHLPPMQSENSAEAIVARLQEEGLAIVTAEAHQGQNCFEFEWPQRAALILGHETRGVSPAFQKAATAHVTIPIYGRAESLNVAMAGTILMYAWARSRQ